MPGIMLILYETRFYYTILYSNILQSTSICHIMHTTLVFWAHSTWDRLRLGWGVPRAGCQLSLAAFVTRIHFDRASGFGRFGLSKGSFKVDIDIEADVDIDGYFGCLTEPPSQFRYCLMV